MNIHASLGVMYVAHPAIRPRENRTAAPGYVLIGSPRRGSASDECRMAGVPRAVRACALAWAGVKSSIRAFVRMCAAPLSGVRVESSIRALVRMCAAPLSGVRVETSIRTFVRMCAAPLSGVRVKSSIRAFVRMITASLSLVRVKSSIRIIVRMRATALSGVRLPAAVWRVCRSASAVSARRRRRLRRDGLGSIRDRLLIVRCARLAARAQKPGKYQHC